MATLKAKANSVVTHALAKGADGTVSGITFTVLGAGDCTLTLANVSAACKERAQWHGFIQRCADGAAKARNTANGQPASPADKLAGIARIVEHYNSGSAEWSLKTERVTSSAQDAADVILALTRATRVSGEPFAKDVDAANAIVARWAEAKGVDRDAAIKAWLTTKQVAACVADIRAARERAKADLVECGVEALMEEAGA